MDGLKSIRKSSRRRCDEANATRHDAIIFAAHTSGRCRASVALEPPPAALRDDDPTSMATRARMMPSAGATNRDKSRQSARQGNGVGAVVCLIGALRRCCAAICLPSFLVRNEAVCAIK